MSELMTLSAISDEIIRIFTETKRQNEFCKFKRITTNQFYFYTFTGQLYTNQPLTIHTQDLKIIEDIFKPLTEKQVKQVIENAIKEYLIREGQGRLFTDKEKTYTWRLV